MFKTFSNDFCFRDGKCPEYSGEEQAICAVGLAKAKPGVFVEAIQFVLVLATPIEVVRSPYLLLISSNTIWLSLLYFIPLNGMPYFV